MFKIKPNNNEYSIWGIYSITNSFNNKKYFGLSTNIKRRWADHKNSLRKNKHENILLQNAWNKYGENCFKFEIIHIMEDKIIGELSNLEKYYINKYNTTNREFGYNLCSGGEINIMNKESIDKRVDSRSKRVVQFSENGEFIQLYLNAREVCRIYTEIKDPSAIYQACKGVNKSSFGYIWRFAEKNEYLKNELFTKNDFPLLVKYRAVVCFDLNGNFVDKFENCFNAQSKYNSSGDNIRACCVGNNKTAYGYIWMYEDEYLKNGLNIKINSKNYDKMKKVAKCEIATGNILKIYDSARDACVDGFNYKNISKVCKGQQKSHKGYFWKFI